MVTKDVKNVSFLRKFIDPEGKVNYKKLKENENWLNDHINRIKETDIGKFDNSTQKLVFYLNCYNLLTLKGVLIQLEKNPNWNGNVSWFKRFKFFYLQKFNIGGKKISLYNLENKILRKEFKDPRIHFAINCASTSCPVLPNNLFEKDSIDELLENLTHSFVNNDMHVNFNSRTNTLRVNPIFKWYKEDFNPEGIVAFIKKYRTHLPEDVQDIKVEYFAYDWSLNN